MKRRAEIVFEKEETILLRQGSAVMNGFCVVCDAAVVMATPEAISHLCDVGEREIFRRIESGKVHCIEVPKVYVCLNSMLIIDEKHE